jgi:hypothetical protein
MKRDRVYISGPITGRDLAEARAHFQRAEDDLQRQGNLTINPLKMRLAVWLAHHDCYRLCLLIELVWVAYRADCIYLLRGWHDSRGAKTEKALAAALDLPVLYEQTKAEMKRERKRRHPPIG